MKNNFMHHNSRTIRAILLLFTTFVLTLTATGAQGTSDDDINELKAQYNKALSRAEAEKNNAAKKRDSLVGKRRQLNQAQDKLESTAKDVKADTIDNLKDEAKSLLPNPKSRTSITSWSTEKAQRADKTVEGYKKVLSAYEDAIDAQENEATRDKNGKTDLDKKIQDAIEKATATEQDYENIKSWGDTLNSVVNAKVKVVLPAKPASATPSQKTSPKRHIPEPIFIDGKRPEHIGVPIERKHLPNTGGTNTVDG